MSNNEIISPEGWPDKAAQQVVLAMIENGLLNTPYSYSSAKDEANAKADIVITAHQKLTEYFQSLSK